MDDKRTITSWASMLFLWAFALVAEVWIQTTITEVRPNADGRGLQAFGALVFLWSWALAWRVPAARLHGAVVGSAVIVPGVVMMALLGQSSPIIAGFLLLVGSVLGDALWRD